MSGALCTQPNRAAEPAIQRMRFCSEKDEGSEGLDFDFQKSCDPGVQSSLWCFLRRKSSSSLSRRRGQNAHHHQPHPRFYSTWQLLRRRLARWRSAAATERALFCSCCMIPRMGSFLIVFFVGSFFETLAFSKVASVAFSLRFIL